MAMACVGLQARRAVDAAPFSPVEVEVAYAAGGDTCRSPGFAACVSSYEIGLRGHVHDSWMDMCACKLALHGCTYAWLDEPLVKLDVEGQGDVALMKIGSHACWSSRRPLFRIALARWHPRLCAWPNWGRHRAARNRSIHGVVDVVAEGSIRCSSAGVCYLRHMARSNCTWFPASMVADLKLCGRSLAPGRRSTDFC